MSSQSTITAGVQMERQQNNDYCAHIVLDNTYYNTQITHAVTRHVLVMVTQHVIQHGGFGEIDFISDPEYGNQINLEGYYTAHLPVALQETIREGVRRIENKIVLHPQTNSRFNRNIAITFSIPKSNSRHY